MKIVFFGTSNIALPVLERLARENEIAAVVTQPDAPTGRKQEMSESPVSVLATELKVKMLKPATVKNNTLLRLELMNINADVFIVVSYGKIIPSDILSIPPHGVLNIHPSLLPKYRGATPIRGPLLKGDFLTGTSIMVMDEEMDHGPILAQEKVSIDPSDNYISLEQRLARASAELISRVLPEYILGKLQPTPQNHEKATYTTILKKEDGRIDWTKTAQQIYNQFRAYYPWPGIWTTWNRKKLKITDCRPTSGISQNVPGTITSEGYVACGDNTLLEIKTLQLEGKNETILADFLRGYRDFSGSKLE